MLFGYTLAVLSGFLLTGASGWRVVILTLLWVAARLALAASVTPWLAAALDLAFAPAVAVMRRPPLWAGLKWPTLGFLPLLAAFFAADLLWHLEACGILPGGAARGEWLALDLVTLMIVVMAGRLVPGYTRAALIPLRQPKDPGRERASVVLAVALLAADQLGWDMACGIAAAALGGMQAWRLSGWRSAAVVRRPLLLVLHLGFAWLVVGLLLRGAAALRPGIAASDAIHATTVGAIGLLTLGMMGRLDRSLGRQVLTASAIDIGAYASLFGAAIARALVPLAAPALREAAYVTAALCWMLAFLLFLVEHGPSLIGIRKVTRSQPQAAGTLRSVDNGRCGGA
jgi:uncharacterized protein involved in response to NO